MEKNFFQEVWERFKMPWKYSAFRSYFIWIVLIFGGFGIFLTILKVSKSPDIKGFVVAQDMSTYFIAIIAASLVDLNLSFSIKNIASLIINSLAFFGVSLLLLYLAYNLESNWAFVPASLGVVLSLVIWVLANADNEKLSDSNYYDMMRGKDVGHGSNWQ